MSLRLVRSTLIGCVLLIASAPLKLTHAQAWLPLRGEGQVTITYENLYVKDHFDYTGKRFDAGPIRTNTVVTNFEYGITNKLTLDSELTHVTSKYEGFVGPVLMVHQIPASIILPSRMRALVFVIMFYRVNSLLLHLSRP